MHPVDQPHQTSAVGQAVNQHVGRRSGPSRLTRWSILTLIMALPIWVLVMMQAVLSRQWDGGIFLSVSAEIARGTDLYSAVWDNKEPLFYGLMALGSKVNPVVPFVMDWIWFPFAAVGTFLIARSVTSADRSLVVAALAMPIAVLQTGYVAGYTSLPGTALTLLSWGMFASGMPRASGITVGILAFTKITVFPIALAGLIALALFRRRRRDVLVAGTAAAAALAIGGCVLALLGWGTSWFGALAANREYAEALSRLSGLGDDPLERLATLAGIWDISHWAIAAATLIVLAMAVNRARMSGESAWLALSTWLAVALVGSVAVLSLTYLWAHHVQLLALPLTIAAVALISLLPANWPSPIITLAVAVPALLFLVGGTPAQAEQTGRLAWEQFTLRRVETSEIPVDARALNAVPRETFTFARLGTNDERGFLRELRPGPTLACRHFHVYSFTPTATMQELRDCVSTVDVVLVTDDFAGMRIADSDAQALVQSIQATFDCERFESRLVCIRPSASAS